MSAQIPIGIYKVTQIYWWIWHTFKIFWYSALNFGLVKFIYLYTHVYDFIYMWYVYVSRIFKENKKCKKKLKKKIPLKLAVTWRYYVYTSSSEPVKNYSSLYPQNLKKKKLKLFPNALTLVLT